MMKSKRSASESILQRVYDEAYRSFVDAMFEDAQGHGEAALEGWLNTLARIEDDHAKIIASPQVSSQEITLYARIVDIERQSKDRVYTYAQSFSGNSLSPDELKIVYEQLRAEKRRQIQEQRALEEAAKQLPQRSGNRKASRPDAMRSVSGGSTTSTLTSQPPPAPARAPSPIKKTMLMTLRGPRHFKKDSSSTTAKASKSKTTQVPAATAATVAWSASSSNNSPPHYAPPRQSSETSRQVSSSAPADEEGLMKAMFKNFSSTSLTSIPANEAPNTAATSNPARRNPSSSSTNAEADFPHHSYPPPPPKAPTPDYILHPEPRRPANGSLSAPKVRDSRSPSPVSVPQESLDSNRNEGLLKLKPSESFIGSVMTSFPVSAPPVPPRSDKKLAQQQQSQSPSADAIYASSESSTWSPVVAGNNNNFSSRSHPFGPRTPAVPPQPVRASSVIRKPVPGFPAQPIKSDSTASNGLPFQFGTEPPPSMSPPPPPAPPPRPPQYTAQSSSSTNIQSPLASPKYPVPPPFNYADSKPSTPSAPASAPPVPPAPPAEPAAPVASASESKPEETTEERAVPPVVVSADEKKEEEQPPVAPEAKAATSSTANSTPAPTTAQAAPAESLSLPPSTFPFHPHSSKPNGVTAKASAGRASPMTAGQRKTQAATRTRANGGANSMTSQSSGQKDGSKEKRSHQPYGLTPPSSTRRLMSPTRASAAKAKPPIHAPTPQKATEQPTLVPATSTTTTTNPDGHLPPLLPDSPDPEHQEWNNRVNEALKSIVGVEENAARQILNEIVVKGDEVHWDDIAGLEQAKTSLKETVVYPFLRPDLFKGLREPARGMLLFGPPGTGKTMLARAVATESQSTFFSISASSLTSKYLGESEKLVKALFALARALAPSIIFVDEIDSLLSSRSDTGEHEASRRIKTEFLVKWSDLAHAAAGRDHQDDNAQRVLVLAATNLPWAIDEAARRRFVRRQYIPLPERETRKKHLQTLLEYQVHGLSEEDVDRLVTMTDGFSGSDITALAKDAAMGPLRSLGEALLSTPRDQIRPVTVADFEASLKTIRPSVSKEGLQAFEEWALKYGSSGA